VKVKLGMGGKTDLDRVVAYIPSEWKKELEEWAEADERSVSWVVAKLIDKALQERRNQQSSSKVVNMGETNVLVE
jgi:predicted RNA-binding protein